LRNSEKSSAKKAMRIYDMNAKEEIPGYVTQENYDIMRKKAFKADEKVEALELRVKDLENDLQQALFIKADHIAREVKEQEQRFATSDSNVITNAIMDLRKLLLKPGVKVRKIKTVIMGDTIIEVQYET
jgi:hypothetical protein